MYTLGRARLGSRGCRKGQSEGKDECREATSDNLRLKYAPLPSPVGAAGLKALPKQRAVSSAAQIKMLSQEIEHLVPAVSLMALSLFLAHPSL